MVHFRFATWVRRFVALVAILFLFAISLAHASPLIAPNAYYWGGSDGWVSGGAGGRLQQVHHRSQFWPATETHTISGLAWRPNRALPTTTYSWTITYIEVWLSTTTRDIGDLNPVFAANSGTDSTRVYSGPITFTYSLTNYDVTHGFQQEIPFQVPFHYRPGDGNLLVDFISTDDAHNIWQGQVDMAISDQTSCVWGAHQYPNGNQNVWGPGVVTQFQTDCAWTPPLPVNVCLLSLALAPAAVKGYENSVGMVRLDAPAPPGGLDVALASDSPTAFVTSLIHIGTGLVEGKFTVFTGLATNTTNATITATLNVTNHLSTALTIKRTYPPVGEPEDIWQTEIVPNPTPNTARYGAWSSIALYHNEPFIAFEDPIHQHVNLAHKTATGWILTTVDGDPALPGQALFAGGPISLKLDHLGHPNLAYFSEEGLRWARFNGSSWTYNKVDASTEPIGISLVLDTDDHAHIAFFDAGGGTEYGLYYVHWNGSGWDQNHFQVSGSVWNDGYKGTSSALALDSNGIPSIAFSDPGTGQLRITKLNSSPDNSDAKWVSTLATGAVWSAYASLAIDGSNRPHIAYQRAEPGTNTVLQHARFTGTNWLITTADAGGPSHYDVGANTSLVLDPQQCPRVSYWDTTLNTIRYARFDGTTWLTHLLDPTNHVGLFTTSLALDAWATPHFSYYEQHTQPNGVVTGSLRYATLAPPRMKLAPKPDGTLELVWPSEPAGFYPISTTNVAENLWQPWNVVQSEAAGIKRTTFPGLAPARFFLLQRPN